MVCRVYGIHGGSVLKLSFAPAPVQVWARRDAREISKKNVILGSEFTAGMDVEETPAGGVRLQFAKCAK